MKKIAIVQARFGSTRRPGKSLAMVGGSPLIDIVLNRAIAIPGVSSIFLATSNQLADDQLSDHVRQQFGDEVAIRRGSEFDVRSRFVNIARDVGPAAIARITADDPFRCPGLTGAAFAHLEDLGLDYVRLVEDLFPLGMGIEVFSSSALLRAAELSSDSKDQEHVTPALLEAQGFIRGEIPVPLLLRVGGRLTVDFEEDIAFCSRVQETILSLGGDLGWETTVAALKQVQFEQEKW